MNVLHYNRTQSSCDPLFLRYCKNITNFLFGVLSTCLVTSIKKNNANLLKLWCFSACKKWTPFLSSFLRYYKPVTLTTLRMPDHAHQWWQYHLVGNFDAQSVKTNLKETSCLSACKKSTSYLTSFWDVAKTLQSCYFGNFGDAWPSPSKIILSVCYSG